MTVFRTQIVGSWCCWACSLCIIDGGVECLSSLFFVSFFVTSCLIKSFFSSGFSFSCCFLFGNLGFVLRNTIWNYALVFEDFCGNRRLGSEAFFVTRNIEVTVNLEVFFQAFDRSGGHVPTHSFLEFINIVLVIQTNTKSNSHCSLWQVSIIKRTKISKYLKEFRPFAVLKCNRNVS